MGRWLFEALSRRRASRRMWKLKSLLTLTACRLSVLRNQRNASCSQARSDIIQLLLLRQQDRALIRAELLIKEQNMVDAFAMVESYCHFLSDRSFLIEHLKCVCVNSHLSLSLSLSRSIAHEMQCLGEGRECPEELKEAAAGLSFAASRCGDVPELQEVRKFLSSRFGRDFTSAAVELRNNCGVDAKMVQKFSAKQPSLECRLNVMKELAMEKGLDMEIITGHFSHVSEVEEHTNLWTENQVEEMVTPHLDSASHGDDKVKVRAETEYKDVMSAAQAAFESASYAAVAARAAVELFQSEAERRGSCNEMRLEPDGQIKEKKI